jgi:amino acid transporter
VWLSFLFGGIVAVLLGYAITKLSVRYPSKGGLVSYLQQGFGDTHVSGMASWLYYMAGLIVTAMVALSFGSYARSLFLPDDASAAWVKVFAVVAVISMALVYMVGPDVVGRLQSVIVVVLLIVFGVFIVATVSDVDVDQLTVAT